jgi:signal transduction histidine kinase
VRLAATRGTIPPVLHEALGIAVGLVEIALAIVVLRALGRFGRSFPWLLALIAFFLVRGLANLWTAFGYAHEVVTVTTDAFVLVTLVMLVVGLRSTIVRLRRAEDDATARAEDYRRALVDYRTLARHRIANAVTVIHGSAETLLAHDVGDDLRDRLLHEIRSHAMELGQALEPEVRAPEEEGLRPAPTAASPRAR